MTLSAWQRIKRRLSLMGGSYEHPDGFLELDFEVDAGIERGDSDAVKERKLAIHAARQRTWQKVYGGILVGVAACYLVFKMGVPTVDAIAIGGLVSWGLMLIAR